MECKLIKDQILHSQRRFLTGKYSRKKIYYGDRQIISKKIEKSKWDSFDEFVNILKEYVDNEYYGGFECKIEKGNIVDSKDWRRRKYKKDNG